MAVLQKVKIGNEWVPVSGSNVNTGGEASSSNTFIINSDKDFEVIEDSSLAGVISDPNTTYNDIKNAIDNNYNIALKEPRGNISYCLRADFVLEDQESGNKRIALFFTKSILTIRYDIILYIGLNNSILYMISKNDIFSKQEVEESIDNKAPYVGKEAPTTNTSLWIDLNDEDEPSSPSVDNGIRYYVLPEGLVSSLKSDSEYTFTTEEAEVYNKVCSEWKTHNYIVILNHMSSDGYLYRAYPTEVICDGVHMSIWLEGEGNMQYEAATDIININETPNDDGAIIATA